MKLAQLEHELYAKLTPWQRTQLARHPQRPSTLDYIGEIFRDFLEFHGDRSFGDDRAIVGGFARFNDRSVMVIGHQKGKTLKAPIPASGPKSVARPKPSREICMPCHGSPCRSSRSSSARAEAEARWRSVCQIASSCSSTASIPVSYTHLR